MLLAFADYYFGPIHTRTPDVPFWKFSFPGRVETRDSAHGEDRNEIARPVHFRDAGRPHDRAGRAGRRPARRPTVLSSHPRRRAPTKGRTPTDQSPIWILPKPT
ncbi:hypothetical protein Aph02nite_09910 [Actinoplanes philippinensis]|nr:hypothetical protein Aph02nite_09910 [Actinoplanes philippinensis]